MLMIVQLPAEGTNAHTRTLKKWIGAMPSSSVVPSLSSVRAWLFSSTNPDTDMVLDYIPNHAFLVYTRPAKLLRYMH